MFTNFANSQKGPRIYFRHVNVDTLLSGTPLEGSHLTGHLNGNEDKTVGICNYRYKDLLAPSLTRAG